MERLRPLGQPGQDLESADDDLDREQAGRAQRQPDERRMVALRPPGDDRERRRRSARRRRRPSDAGRGRRSTSVTAGKSVPPISGQSGKTSADVVAVTCEPNSSSAKVTRRPERREQREPLAARRGRRAGPGSRPARSGRRAAPTSVIAAARCAVTDSPLLPRRTVSRPSHAWKPTRPTAPSDGQRIERRSRWSRMARTARPRISKPMITATVRWIHSIQAFGSPSAG